MTDLSTSIGNVIFGNPLTNASGVWCTTQNELMEMSQSKAGGIVSKSCTLEHRQGNPEPRSVFLFLINFFFKKLKLKKPRYYAKDQFSINSMGIPNLGHEFYLDMRNNLRNKPYSISVSGLSWTENESILKKFKNVLNEKDGNLMIELNISCPNVIGKPQLGMILDFLI